MKIETETAPKDEVGEAVQEMIRRGASRTIAHATPAADDNWVIEGYFI